MKYCLATVCTKDFIPGCLVLFHSFLTKNPWFSGDLIVIHDDLTIQQQKKFFPFKNRIKFLPASGATLSLLHKLQFEKPQFTRRIKRFYSVEAFSLQRYDRVLFCDCDLLFLDTVEEIFQMNAPLIACGDGAHHRKNGRDLQTYGEISDPNLPQFKNTFNAGFLSIGPELISGASYRRLQSMLSPEYWGEIKTDHTDQFLYNRLFCGRQTLISSAYNYLMIHKDDQLQNEGLNYSQAKVLHFNGNIKPWMPAKILQSNKMDEDYINALGLWNEAYLSFVNLSK